MSSNSSVPSVTVPVLRAPRRYTCYALPEGFDPPTSPERRRLLAETVADRVGLPALTPICAEIARHVWLFAFLHGASRQIHAATYEHGHPGLISYIPRNADLVLVDWNHSLLYISGPHADRLSGLLPALNGTLFPERRCAAPFQPLAFDLTPLRLMSPTDRHPSHPGAPWAQLRLKGLTWQEAGLGGAHSRRVWPLDGFDDFEATGDQWPDHLASLTLSIRLPQHAHPYVAEFFQGTAELRATISPKTLPALTDLIDKVSQVKPLVGCTFRSGTGGSSPYGRAR